jgi:exodeoxyribonuclease VII large subunit
MEERIYTVSEISREIKRVIEQFIPPVWVEGEISNYSVSRAGHIYFALKDENALINCVVWRNVAGSIPFQLTGGMHVIVRGDVITYAAQSQYQINVMEIRAAGLGSLYLAFEALKQKLSAEGLFAPELKKPLPQFPRRVGVITSLSGAAVQDILQVSRRRNPAVELVIFPAQVQGEKAADTIIEGIQTFNRLNNVDFIILARGGGSIEDLWAFNEEKLVRAIADSQLPVVSAVGHEVDFTLADFVADFRAPTPSAAAETTIPESTIIQSRLNTLTRNICQRISELYRQKRQTFENLVSRIKTKNPVELIHQRYQRLDELDRRMSLSVVQRIKHSTLQLEKFTSTLQALNPKQVLQRGYSIVYQRPTTAIVKSIRQVHGGEELEIEVADGRYDATVT